ncbi:MAG TPA: Maf-like protein, partial [Dehalococcoidia bacterium]|nr:Maf-like protein [Dehalococcoidia bacterium]
MNSAPRKTLPTILLASSSPRRREIMQGVENLVKVLSPDIEEGPRNAGESPEEYVSRLSREKAEASMVNGIVGTILAADTTVVL